MVALHVTNGDAVAPAVAAAAGVPLGDVVPWRDVLHDGPVPAGLGPDELLRVRAAHLAARGWTDELTALTQLRDRDRRLAEHPADAEVVLWFEPDLYDDLQFAQVSDRLAGRPGPVTLVVLSHMPSANLRQPFLDRKPFAPSPEPWATFRSPDPRAWERVPAFTRLCEELPDVSSGLSRLEAAILDALADAPLDQFSLYQRVAAREQVPWIADQPLWSLADDLAPLVAWDEADDRPGRYELTAAGAAVRAGAARRPPRERWLGGVRVGPGEPQWAWDPQTRRVLALSAR